MAEFYMDHKILYFLCLFLVLDEFPKSDKTITVSEFESAVIVCEHVRREGVRKCLST